MTFEIISFSLKERGFGGLEAKLRAYYDTPSGSTIKETGSRERKIPISGDLRRSINKLKKYYLVLTAHWLTVYDNYLNSETNAPRVPDASKNESYNGPWMSLERLWKITEITGANIDEDGAFLIKGYLTVLDKKPQNISTVKVTQQDDYGFYHETIKILNEIAEEIVKYFTFGLVLESPRETIEALGGFGEDSDVESMSEEEMVNFAMELLEKRGAIILKDVDTLGTGEEEKKPAPEEDESFGYKKPPYESGDRAGDGDVGADDDSGQNAKSTAASPQPTPPAQEDKNAGIEDADVISHSNDNESALGITIPDGDVDDTDPTPGISGDVVDSGTIDGFDSDESTGPELDPNQDKYLHSENMGEGGFGGGNW